MVLKKTTLNAIQKIPETPLTGTALSAATNTMYTCPTGKKAKISGYFYLDNYGAASIVQVRANSITFVAWNITNPDAGTEQYKNRQITDVELQAGQTLIKAQDVGDNATLRYVLRVLELPI